MANVTVVEGDATDTRLPEGCCDAVFMRDVFHHLTDAAAINASIARALRPGGVFVVIDFLPGNEGHGITPEKLVEERYSRRVRADPHDRRLGAPHLLHGISKD